MRVQDFFRADELAAIEAANVAAEAKSGGEIVVYVVAACDDYDEARFKGAALGAAAAAMAAGALHHFGGHWGGWGLAWITLPVLAGLTAGYFAVLASSALRRWLTPASERARRADQRAAQAFLQEEVFSTVDRSGVLLFLALFEHRVVVLADAGIRAKVASTVWDELAQTVAAGARVGRAGPALVTAIERCGDILAEAGVTRRADDRDELPNQARLRDA
jgi:putative membrane protein